MSIFPAFFGPSSAVPPVSKIEQKQDMILDNQWQILDSLKAMRQDQFNFRRTTQEALNRQQQEQATQYRALANGQDRLQGSQHSLFTDQRFIIGQLDALKLRLNRLTSNFFS